MEFDLVKHTILLTKAGSRAYGMHTKDSDLDVKGVAIAPKEYYMGCLKNFEQADGKENIAAFKSFLPQEELVNGLEGTVYEAKKFIALVADCNPNNLDALFCREQEVMIANALGKLLREHRDLFISQRAMYSYAGYARSQLKRIQLHRAYFTNPPDHEPTRAEHGAVEVIEKYKYDAAFSAIQKQVDGWELDLSAVPKSDRIEIQNQFAEKLAEMQIVADEKWLRAARTLGFNDDLLSKLEAERKFRRAQTEWKQYQDWKKNRNPERAAMEEKFGLDLKHATHLIRLLKMCVEIMSTGKINVWRGGIDADELLAIRSGAMTYDQICEYADKLEVEAKKFYNSKECPIPKRADVNKVNLFCMQLIEAGIKQHEIMGA